MAFCELEYAAKKKQTRRDRFLAAIEALWARTATDVGVLRRYKADWWHEGARFLFVTAPYVQKTPGGTALTEEKGTSPARGGRPYR